MLRWLIHLPLVLTGLVGIVAVFLPFTYDTSPLRAMQDDELWQLAAPFFLSLLILPLSVHWAATGRLSPVEKWLAYASGMAMGLVTLSFYTIAEHWPQERREWLLTGLFAIALSAGVVGLFKSSRSASWIAYTVSAGMTVVTVASFSLVYSSDRPDRIPGWIGLVLGAAIPYCGVVAVLRCATAPQLAPFSAVMAMQGAYLANSLLCLGYFFGEWQGGAHCALVASAGYLVQIILVWRWPGWLRSASTSP